MHLRDYHLFGWAAVLLLVLPLSLKCAGQSLESGDLLAPRAFRMAADQVRSSIVLIESFGGIPSTQGRIGGVRRPGDGPTTGLIVSADGYIVTSTFNFIRKPPIITVRLHDGSKHVARLLGRDHGRRLCMLKIDDVENLPVPRFVSRSELQPGQWAVSVGVGFEGERPALSAGILSATSRIMGRAVQTDANTSPANYGGPLVDIEGRVIGICVPLHPESEEAGSGVEWYDSGIGFAIPLAGEERLLSELKKADHVVQPGYLGVEMKDRVDQIDAAAIRRCVRDGPADRAGLKANDRIVELNSERILNPAQLRIALGRRLVGESVTLTVRRGDRTLTVDVVLGAVADRSAEKSDKSLIQRLKSGDS